MAHLRIPGDPPVRLHVEDSGGAGRPVVLIHGWPLSTEAWTPQVPALKAAGYRVVAYDRRGFGRSDQPSTGYDYDTLAADLDALMVELDLTGAVLVGFSMGGGEVARYVGTYGESRLAGVVFAGSITPALCVTDDNPDGGMPISGFEDLAGKCAADRDGFVQTFMTWFFSNPDSLAITPEQFGDVLRIAGQGSDEALVACIRAWTTDFRADIATITVPTLVIHGDADNNVPLEASGRRTAALIPGADLHVIAGGPHGSNLSHTDEFNAALLTYLDALPT